MKSLLHGTSHARLEARLFNGAAHHCIQYSNSEKLKLVTLIDKVTKEDGVKATQAAAAFGVSSRFVSRWCKVLQVEALKNKNARAQSS
jgi:hypothetical protein